MVQESVLLVMYFYIKGGPLRPDIDIELRMRIFV